ncbi:uncharacterized protein LOC107882698 [Acyrthosiphon pisum]|uniref:Uncharacterized protein n=1 Tax=Acyrthosiphon pisum TaxID=7029 RepID=A0A8R2JLQ0_ACYPI|nr:uncharacterized protein LOC107882698 [Acyrthosiphon pisum]
MYFILSFKPTRFLQTRIYTFSGLTSMEKYMSSVHYSKRFLWSSDLNLNDMCFILSFKPMRFLQTRIYTFTGLTSMEKYMSSVHYIQRLLWSSDLNLNCILLVYVIFYECNTL